MMDQCAIILIADDPSPRISRSGEEAARSGVAVSVSVSSRVENLKQMMILGISIDTHTGRPTYFLYSVH